MVPYPRDMKAFSGLARKSSQGPAVPDPRAAQTPHASTGCGLFFSTSVLWQHKGERTPREPAAPPPPVRGHSSDRGRPAHPRRAEAGGRAAGPGGALRDRAGAGGRAGSGTGGALGRGTERRWGRRRERDPQGRSGPGAGRDPPWRAGPSPAATPGESAAPAPRAPRAPRPSPPPGPRAASRHRAAPPRPLLRPSASAVLPRRPRCCCRGGTVLPAGSRRGFGYSRAARARRGRTGRSRRAFWRSGLAARKAAAVPVHGGPCGNGAGLSLFNTRSGDGTVRGGLVFPRGEGKPQSCAFPSCPSVSIFWEKLLLLAPVSACPSALLLLEVNLCCLHWGMDVCCVLSSFRKCSFGADPLAVPQLVLSTVRPLSPASFLLLEVLPPACSLNISFSLQSAQEALSCVIHCK